MAHWLVGLAGTVAHTLGPHSLGLIATSRYEGVEIIVTEWAKETRADAVAEGGILHS